VRIDFQGRGNVETFPRARVQPMGAGIQFTLGVARQVRALGQVLAQQAIRILVGAALPGAVRSSKEDLDREPLGQAFVLGPLVASIIRQGFPQQGGHRAEFFGKARSGTRGIGPGHLGQDDQACGPLHQSPDGRPIASALEQVTLPVARHRAGSHLGGPLSDRRHIGNLAAAVGSSCPRPTRLACLPQRRQQFAAQGSAGQHIQTHLDRLGREMFAHVVRIRASEASGNLLGRAALGQLRPHVLPQPGIQEFARASGLTGSGGRQRLCRAGTIGRAHRVTGVLAAQGARGSPQHPRHRSQRLAMGQTQTQGFTFFRIHVSVGSCSHDNTVTHLGVKCCTWS